MHARDTDHEVAEHALETLERLVSEGDLELARVTYELVLPRIPAMCDPAQFERLRLVEEAVGHDTAGPRR